MKKYACEGIFPDSLGVHQHDALGEETGFCVLGATCFVLSNKLLP